jgi:uroporphyrinogen III methyltransferase/synthase
MEVDGKGSCILVGAGPGDIGLVTLRAREAVEGADVIVYDHLCNPEILQWAPASAEIVYAGKKAAEHAMSQDEINQLLVDRANAGKRVVRLKGGDPFVFGRGGEEAEVLAAAQIPFEVVPGISSAIAAPAYAGIPVTHRGITSSFTVFTGHEDGTKEATSIDYEALVDTKGTLVMLMGVERLGAVVSQFLAHGADKNLPVALIRWGTTGGQETVVGALDSIVEKAHAIRPPAIAVFGEVVRLRDKLNWFERRPLFGRRIVVTRTRKQASALSSQLRRYGADVYELPTIRIEPPEDLLEFGELVRDAYQYDWLVFTSANGVDAFFQMFFKLYDDIRSIGNVKIAAIGPATGQRVKDFGLTVDLQPEEFVAESIVEAFQAEGSVENLKFLIARAAGARELLPKRLTQLGAIVDEAIAYRSVPELPEKMTGLQRFQTEGADLVTFTSSSTVENFKALNLKWPVDMKTASIGPITSATMRNLAIRVDIEAKQHDIPGLVAAILAHWSHPPH